MTYPFRPPLPKIRIEESEWKISADVLYGVKLFPENLSEQSHARPTLVFLHEGLGSVAQWKDFPLKLVQQTGCPALVYDRIGYGRSSAAKTQRDLQYLHREALETLPEVLRLSQISECILIGHSDGGSIALIFASNPPSKISLKGVITEAAHVFVEEITLEGIRKAKELYLSSSLKEKLARYHGEKTDDLFEAWVETWLSPEFRDWNIESFLPKIFCPILAIQGEQDEYGSILQVDSLVTKSGGTTEAVIVPNCAHIPHFQSQEFVLNIMTKFINRICHSVCLEST